MKRNAIVRICVYAGLILVLIGILLVGLFGMGPRHRPDYAVESMAAVPVTMPVEDRQVLATGKTRYAVDTFSSPDSGALCNGRIIKGASVNILEIITTNGEDWAYVSWGRDEGWVQLPLLELDGETVSEETTVVFDATEIATAKEKLNIRSEPSEDASMIGWLDTGSRVRIFQIQQFGGTEWACIGWDSNYGWVMMEYLELDETAESTDVEIIERHGRVGTAKVLENLNLRSSPSQDAPNIGMLPKGSQVEVTQILSTRGTEWAYVSLGEDRGWAMAEYLEVDENFRSSLEDEAAETTDDTQAPLETVTEETTAPALPEMGKTMEGKHYFDADRIKELEIDWAAGNVTIHPDSLDCITITETRALTAKALDIQSKDGRLKIRFEKGEKWEDADVPPKDLLIRVPYDYAFRELDVEMTDGQVTLRDLEADNLELDSTSARLDVVTCTVDKLEAHTDSGEMHFTGSVNQLEYEGTSADLSAAIVNHPQKMELKTKSGTLILTLPQDFGFTAVNKGEKGGFMTDFVSRKPGSNVFGNGSCHVEIDNPHGSVYIRKADK